MERKWQCLKLRRLHFLPGRLRNTRRYLIGNLLFLFIGKPSPLEADRRLPRRQRCPKHLVRGGVIETVDLSEEVRDEDARLEQMAHRTRDQIGRAHV